MEDHIVPANKRLRAWTILITVLLVAIACAALAVLRGQLREIEKLAEDNRQAAVGRMMRLTASLAWAGGLVFVGMGGYLWRIGRRINRAGRFPPPGMKVVKDTAVRTGAKARIIAGTAQLAAMLCVVIGTAGMYYLYRTIAALCRN